VSAVCVDGGLPVSATRSPIADNADDHAQKWTPKPPSVEASFLTSRTPCLGSSILIARMTDRTFQRGVNASKSLLTPTRPEVRNWFAKIEFQEMYFCDVTNKFPVLDTSIRHLFPILNTYFFPILEIFPSKAKGAKIGFTMT
jgi:hypothetical protein